MLSSANLKERDQTKYFICERCTYLLDNNNDDEEKENDNMNDFGSSLLDSVRCFYCEELKGIMIYCGDGLTR